MRPLSFFSSLLVLASCASPSGDTPAPYQPSVLGAGERLRAVQDPAAKLANQSVAVTSVVVTSVDNFDETHDGKSRGTITVQDADQGGPLSGISLYSPSFQPTSLRLAPGDVVDMAGQYVEQQTIGTTVNFAPAFLPQMSKPVVTFRFEVNTPAPTLINIADLASFTTGRQWVGLLVTVHDVTVQGAPTDDGHGRVTALVTGDKNGAAISNELFDIPENSFPANTHFSAITGVVTYFFNLKIAPRSQDDLTK